MPSATLATTLDGSKTRLVIDGGWSSAADAAVARGGFDRLELQRGEYPDLQCLAQHKNAINDLWINALCASTSGLESLDQLRKLQLGYPADKKVSFSSFPHLTDIVLEHWKPYYAGTLFECKNLESLSIDGFTDADCGRIGKLVNLKRLALYKGMVRSLDGLAACRNLLAVIASHTKKLDDISELSQLPALRIIEFRENLTSLRDIEPVFRISGLRVLDLKGCAATLETVDWLASFVDLTVLMLPKVKNIRWESLFASKQLELLLVGLVEEGQTSVEAAVEAARAHGLVPTERKILGKGKHAAMLLKF